MSQKSPLTSTDAVTEQICGFTLHIKHMPASLSHRELHHPMPIADVIRAVRNNQQPRINQESKRLITAIHKNLAQTGLHHEAQLRFLILAQSRQLALSILHGKAFLAQLQACFTPLKQTKHQPQEHPHTGHATVLLCYPTQEEPLCTPHMVQTNYSQTKHPHIMAHIFTPQEVDRIAQYTPEIHPPEPTTPPAENQEH